MKNEKIVSENTKIKIYNYIYKFNLVNSKLMSFWNMALNKFGLTASMLVQMSCQQYLALFLVDTSIIHDWNDLYYAVEIDYLIEGNRKRGQILIEKSALELSGTKREEYLMVNSMKELEQFIVNKTAQQKTLLNQIEGYGYFKKLEESEFLNFDLIRKMIWEESDNV